MQICVSISKPHRDVLWRTTVVVVAAPATEDVELLTEEVEELLGEDAELDEDEDEAVDV